MPVYDFFMSEKSRKQTTNQKSYVLKISAIFYLIPISVIDEIQKENVIA